MYRHLVSSPLNASNPVGQLHGSDGAFGVKASLPRRRDAADLLLLLLPLLMLRRPWTICPCRTRRCDALQTHHRHAVPFTCRYADVQKDSERASDLLAPTRVCLCLAQSVMMPGANGPAASPLLPNGKASQCVIPAPVLAPHDIIEDTMARELTFSPLPAGLRFEFSQCQLPRAFEKTARQGGLHVESRNPPSGQPKYPEIQVAAIAAPGEPHSAPSNQQSWAVPVTAFCALALKGQTVASDKSAASLNARTRRLLAGKTKAKRRLFANCRETHRVVAGRPMELLRAHR
jgi:hypothetical protein